ncbi:pumilio-like protein 12-like [Gossypium australe]|uniref:Pumilio-like protein 12-like n=1 Tax=Gossypium australe TaxID=47621 RepID=A0A5B6WV62_9ROSI|nr:pumilio-like protein 12-like [Gossypium australe]
MESGNRSMWETPLVPPSRSLGSYVPHHSLTSPQNLLDNNPFDQSLESAFFGLNLSTQKNPELDYGFSVGEKERKNEGLHVGFDGVLRVGPYSDSWNSLVPRSYQLPDLNENGYLFDSRREHVFNEISILPFSYQSRLAPPLTAAGAGCSRNKNVTRASFNSHNNDQISNGFRRSRWSHEPLNCLSIGDLRGRFLSLAKDQYGCRFLERAIDEASREEIDMILMEVIGHVDELMLDPFANYVVQKLVVMCNEEQKSQIILMIVKDGFRLVNICLNVRGTRAVQKLLENLTSQRQISLIISALTTCVVALTKDMNGHRVIQCCLKNFSDQDNKYLLKEVADNCYQIATDKSGCCAMQHCIDHSKGEAKANLVREIIANALHLAEDRYGCIFFFLETTCFCFQKVSVLQHVLGLKERQTTESLLRQLEGNYASLSCNRYGSNVVEKCMLESGEEQSTRIIKELLRSPIGSRLLVDRFGNYVIQSALSVSKGFVYNALLNLVWVNFPMMRNHVYGRWVLAWFNKRATMQLRKAQT